jgi:hypothetical protein
MRAAKGSIVDMATNVPPPMRVLINPSDANSP